MMMLMMVILTINQVNSCHMFHKYVKCHMFSPTFFDLTFLKGIIFRDAFQNPEVFLGQTQEPKSSKGVMHMLPLKPIRAEHLINKRRVTDSTVGQEKPIVTNGVVTLQNNTKHLFIG